MRLQKFGHSCLLVETGDARLLLDPGIFSRGFEELTGLTAVLLTHQHPDHIDPDRLRAVLERNPEARLYADEATAGQLAGGGELRPTAVHAGDTLDIGAPIEVLGELHAEIHRDIPRIPNVGYVIDGRLFHPGDALTVPDREVEILALPTAAPWMRAADAVDYLREIHPRTAIPIHEMAAAVPGMYYGLFRQLGPEGSDLRIIDDGDPYSL
jgi:L-ascorbate metabolism protein UlaG (beta-lactamase superfamily)